MSLDVDGPDDRVVEGAQHTQPLAPAAGAAGGEDTPGPRRATPARPFERALPAPVSRAVNELAFGADLAALRLHLSEWAYAERLEEEATAELVLAVNELATNSVRYGGGSGTMLTWREGATLMCEIRDAGHIEDALIGRTAPAVEQHSGRGLWLVNRLCDLVQIRSSPSGTAIRVQKRCPASGHSG